MTLADDLRPLLASVRAIPGQLGLREHSVKLIGARTSGSTGYTGDGGRWELETAIQHTGGYAPKVRWAKDQDVAMNLVAKGSVTVGPITSDFTGYEHLENLTGGNLESTTLTVTNNSSSIPIHYGHAIAPGALLAGMGRAPRVAPNTNDNYGETALVIWLADFAFGLANNSFVYSVRSSA